MAIGLPELFLLIGVCIVIVGVSVMYLIDKLNKVSIFNKSNEDDDTDWSYVACGRPKKLYEKYKKETLDKYKEPSVYDDDSIFHNGIR